VMSLMFEKSIVSPGAALAIASRNEPGPLSAEVVTVAARTGPASRAAVRIRSVGMAFLILALMAVLIVFKFAGSLGGSRK
jgi:hypothetical protein